MIRSLLLSGVASFALATGAFAADLPNVKGPPVYVPPPPVFSWTGIYIGINGGYAGGPINYNHLTDYSSYVDSSSVQESSGFVGGGTIGINYQWPGSNFVIGFEGDFDGSSIRARDDFSGYGESYSVNDPNDTKVNWIATARARLGWAFGNILPYVTGGGAFVNQTQYRFCNGCDAFASAYENWGVSQTVTGWTAGAGVEYAITHNLTIKVEYLYVGLPKQNYESLFDSQIEDGYDSHSARTQLNIVRAGLNWKFDWLAPPVPVVAKY